MSGPGKSVDVDQPGEHVVVLRADAGRVRSVRPVQENLLVRRTGLAEDRRVVTLVEVPPEAGQAGRDLVTLQHAGSHPEVVQLGEDLAVQVGHGVPGEEGGGQPG